MLKSQNQGIQIFPTHSWIKSLICHVYRNCLNPLKLKKKLHQLQPDQAASSFVINSLAQELNAEKFNCKILQTEVEEKTKVINWKRVT